MERYFEWAFTLPDVEDLADPRLDLLTDWVDTVCQSHADLTVVTVLLEGRSALETGIAAVEFLRRCNLFTPRSHLDLVTIPEIAERADVTRQAVANWITGIRRGDSFPPPANLVNGGVWLWHDVDKWLKERHKDVSNGVSYPTFEDHTKLDIALDPGGLAFPWRIDNQTVAARRPAPTNFNFAATSSWVSTLEPTSRALNRWRRLRLLADQQMANSSPEVANAIDRLLSMVEDDVGTQR